MLAQIVCVVREVDEAYRDGIRMAECGLEVGKGLLKFGDVFA